MVRLTKYLRSDGLLVEIEFSRSIALILTLANTEHLVIDRSTMAIAVLTSTCHGRLDVRWMSGTDTSDLPQTLVSLSWQLLGSPSTCDTLETVALGDGNAVHHLVLLKDCVNLYRLF